MAYSDLSNEALVHKMLETERELVRAQFKHSMNQLENTSKLRVLRRNIAKMRTEVRAREAAGSLKKNELVVRHRSSFGSAAPSSAPSVPAPERGGFLSGIVDKLTSKE